MVEEEQEYNQYRLTVIVADELATKNLPSIIERLSPQSHSDVEYIFCSGSDISSIVTLERQSNVKIINAAAGVRIPLLWRDGILAASAKYVVLTTAHCMPSETWLDQLLNYPKTENLVAVGGAIVNKDHDNGVGKAIYLLRYVKYTQARENGEVKDLAADNALYKRSEILKHMDLLEIGFWEPSFHERFIRDGLSMQFDKSLTVEHHNCYSASQFFAQRFIHGTEFGMARAKTMTVAKRFIMICAAPLIPIIFLRKILKAAKKDNQFSSGLAGYFGWLLFFMLGWSIGEARGYIKGNSELTGTNAR